MTDRSFTGFGPRALPFFKALDFHQDKAWFAENRAIYDEEVLGPLGAFVTDLAAACAAAEIPLTGTPRSAIFRINRDVRFAKDKRPYKTHAGAVLTRSGHKSDPGLFYVHVAPDGCFFAAGFYGLEPAPLGAFRKAIVTGPNRFRAVTTALSGAGLAFDRQWSLKRPPREAAGVEDPDLVEALKLKSIVVRRALTPAAIAREGLVQDALAFIETARPLLEFGWSALADLPPARS
jgi:uncharacterized protein (TIGR02453 family)